MVVNKWLNRTTEVVEDVVRHYAELVNTLSFFAPVLLESKYLRSCKLLKQTLQLVQYRICIFELRLKLA